MAKCKALTGSAVKGLIYGNPHEAVATARRGNWQGALDPNFGLAPFPLAAI